MFVCFNETQICLFFYIFTQCYYMHKQRTHDDKMYSETAAECFFRLGYPKYLDGALPAVHCL